MTHARLRALQGDSAGAVRILKAVLAARPGDPEATALLADLPRGPGPAPEAAEVAAPPPTPAQADQLASRVRRSLARRDRHAAMRRLERFLVAVTRHAR